MDDWAPLLEEPESTPPLVAEEFDPSWPYKFKWGVDGHTGRTDVWSTAGGLDGKPTHRGELRERWGRDPQVREGDQLGMAQYIPAERKITGEIVAPAVVLVHPYYGLPVPPSVIDFFEQRFPNTVVRQAEATTDMKGRPVKLAEWAPTFKLAGTIRWLWNARDGLLVWLCDDHGQPTHDQKAMAEWGRYLNDAPGDYLGYADFEGDGTIKIDPIKYSSPAQAIAQVKAEISKMYPDKHVVTDQDLAEQYGVEFHGDPGKIGRRMSAAEWMQKTVGVVSYDPLEGAVSDSQPKVRKSGLLGRMFTGKGIFNSKNKSDNDESRRSRAGQCATPNCQGDCPSCRRSDDAPLHQAGASAPTSLPSPAGVPAHSRSDTPTDGPAYTDARSLPGSDALPSRLDDWHQSSPVDSSLYSLFGHIHNVVNKAETVNKAAGADMSGAMIALFMPEETGKKIQVKGGEPLDMLHITLVYFQDKYADRDDWDEVAKVVEQVANQTPALSGKINGYGVFNNDEDVLWAVPSLQGLAALREKLAQAVEDAGFPVSKTYDWAPHITLKYDFKGKLPKVEDEITLDIPALSFAHGPNHDEFEFKGHFEKEAGWGAQDWDGWGGTHAFVTDGKEVLTYPWEGGTPPSTLGHDFMTLYPDTKKPLVHGFAIPTADEMGYGIVAPLADWGSPDGPGLHEIVHALDKKLQKPTHFIESPEAARDKERYVMFQDWGKGAS